MLVIKLILVVCICTVVIVGQVPDDIQTNTTGLVMLTKIVKLKSLPTLLVAIQYNIAPCATGYI